jgi:hypothetical protein
MSGDRKQTQALESTLGLSIIAVADLLATYETVGESWHATAVIGHAKSSKIFPFSVMDANILQTRNFLTTVSPNFWKLMTSLAD